jgi:hypothetical protein
VGKAIADHIPPNVVVYGHGYRTRLQAERPLGSPGPKAKKAIAQALKLMGETQLVVVTRSHDVSHRRSNLDSKCGAGLPSVGAAVRL